MIKISAVICTYNRAHLLPKLLERLNQQTLGHDLYEVIIVDNNSGNETAAVVQNFISGHTNFRYLKESKPGLSRCRNLGLRKAVGKAVAFIDDDALPENRWLEEHLKCYERDGKIAAVAGKIDLMFKGQGLPDASLSYANFLGSFAPLNRKTILKWPEFPRGGNFSVLKSAVANIRFSEKLGRKGRSLLSNEEKGFFYEVMVRDGLKVVYNPDAVVFHLVRRSRLSHNFVIRRMFSQGWSEAVFDRTVVGPDSPGFWLAGKLLRRKKKNRTVTEIRRRESGLKLFDIYLKFCYLLGYFRGLFEEYGKQTD